MTPRIPGYDAFIPHFEPSTFVLKYIGLAIFALNFAFWKVFKGTRWVRPSSVDLHSDRQEFFQAESIEDARWKTSVWTKMVGKLRRKQ